MVELKTVIDELRTGKIVFKRKADDCCTTEGEVIILLQRLADLEENDTEEVVRCRDCKYYRKNLCIRPCGPSGVMAGDYCSCGIRRDK